MTTNQRKAISWATGIIVGSAIFLLLLNTPQELDADGTLESRGTGNALTLLVTIGAVYLVTLLALDLKYRTVKSAKEEGED